jgi:serine/threonine protein kinase
VYTVYGPAMHPMADTGRVIAGRYRLAAPIGHGAMGVVWRAWDQLLDRDVAVKEVQIADTLTDAQRANAYRRTLREAKTAARLNHPAVVTVYDVCEDGGRPWIVMQLVSAQSLDQVLAVSGPLSPRRAAGIGRQLLSALSVAHAAGVMHRDVKPSNVLLDQDDRAILTDFGISTFVGDSRLTQTGMVMGSPGFTAPERIRGDDASPTSDLWSLGATLFAAVEGHGPFERGGGAITTISAIINEDAPAAPTAGALAPVIAALLRREPADRPDAAEATRMITSVLPLLLDQSPGGPAGYEPAALSAPTQPTSAQPDSASAGPGPPADAAGWAAAAPTSPQPVQGPASQKPGPSKTSADLASINQTGWWERPSPAVPPETVEADQLLAAQMPTAPQRIPDDTASRWRSRTQAGAAWEGLIPGPYQAVPESFMGPFATAIYLSPDQMHLAVVTRYNNVEVYRLVGERLGEKIAEHHVDRHPRVTWSDSGTALAFVDENRTATILDVPSGKVTPLGGSAVAVAPYPDGSRFAVLDEEMLTIWQANPRQVMQSTKLLSQRREKRFAFGVSPDGQWLASGTGTGAVQILDTESLQVAYEFSGHKLAITDLEWLGPNTFATAAIDETIRIWGLSENRELRALEAEGTVVGISYSAVLDCLTGWTHHDYVVWSVRAGEIVLRQKLPVSADYGYRYVSASSRSNLLVTLNGPELSDIAFSYGWGADRGRASASVSTYANAKVLLLGDSGVGKSGLALVLAGEPFRATESTHARHIWNMPVPELNHGQDAQREVLLWDLAGQPGYRIVHQLHLEGGAAALILFDSRSETAPLVGIGYWARALQHAQASGEPLPTFLIGARTDRGVVGVSDERIAGVIAEFGFRGYLPTSAKEGWGVAELRAAVLGAIDWDRMPVVTSSALFAAAKSFVLDQKAAGTLLTPLASLLAAFLSAPVTGPAAKAAPDAKTGRDLLDSEPGRDEGRLRGVFEGCVARLEAAGLINRLAFGDLVLLQPELVDVYAGAIVNAARDEPDGLGSMLESRVLEVDFRLPAQERITDRQQEKLLIIATLEELTRHEIVLREETEDGVQLVFPAAFRRDLPEAAAPADTTAEFTFEGPVVNIYATLVVRLTRSNRFTRRSAFQSAAQFEADAGGICTVHLIRSDEGRGALQVGYSEDAAGVVRFQFERFVLAHLGRRATPGTVSRVRLYRCPDCGTPFSSAQIEAALGRDRRSLLCPVDETRVPLEDSRAVSDSSAASSLDAVTSQMDASADAARSLAAASSIILGKQETTDFDVFLCHNGDDKPAVRSIDRQLRSQGILPWLDEAELIPGRPWQEELERQIGKIRAAAVFVGPSGIGPWQNREIRAFLNEFTERQCPVIPVLLPKARTPELPLFLRGMTWVDLRGIEAKGIERLIWGITGRRPGPVRPNEPR